MKHVITPELLISILCLLAYLTYLIYKKSKNFNDAMTMHEKKHAKNVELLADYKRRTEVLNEGKTKSNVKMTTQSTQGLPPPPPKTSNVYDKKFPSKNDNINHSKSYLEEDADRRIKELIKNQEEQSEEIEEFKKGYIENIKKWITDVPILQSTHITYEEYVDALKDIASGPLGKKGYHIDEKKQ